MRDGDPFRLAICGVVLLLAVPGSVARETAGEAVRRALPRYDPTVREAALQAATDTAGAATGSGEAVVKQNRKSVAEPEATGAGAVEPGVVQLEPFVVQAWRQRRPQALPRLRLPSAPSATSAAGSFASAQERRRLMKKTHLGVVGQILNPWGFGSLVAGEAEAAALTAERLADTADKIDLALLGGATEQEAKELRELYLEMMVKRNR